MIPAIKKAKLPYVDKLNPRWSGDTPEAIEARRRKNLFTALNLFVIENHGNITSVPGAKVVRIEIPQGSTLPARLAQLGYEPIDRGDEMKTDYSGVRQVHVIEISLG